MGLANITPTQHHTTPTSTALNLRRGASALPVSSSPAPVARPTSAPVLGTGTPEEEAVARQKAAFVAAVMQLTRVEGLAARDAARLEGTRTDRYPALVSAGKGGRSLLAASSAYANYRSWLTKLGRTADNRPDLSNWTALLPRYRNSRAYSRPGDDRFWVGLARLYEHPNKLALSDAHDYARRAYLAAGGSPDDVPSYDQARYYYTHHADRKAVLIAREGADWARNHLASYIERDAPQPDEIWSSDHRQLDMAVRVWDADNGRWIPKRPWLTVWVDWGSLYFLGHILRVEDPNRDVIERSLKLAIEQNENHPPVHLYIDNGADYKARGLLRPILGGEGDQTRCRSIAEAIGANVTFARPYNARAKIAERTFKAVGERFDKLWSGYRGNSPRTRPGEADAVWKHPENLPTLEEAQVAIGKWLALDYHDRPSHGKALQGKTPHQARQAMTHPRPALDNLSLYKAFLRELGARTIQRGGIVKILNRTYQSDDLWALLGQVKEVRVKVDPDDIDTAWIYTLDGREVGPAYAKKLLPPMVDETTDPTTVEQLRVEIAREKRQMKELRTASAARRGLAYFPRNPDVALPPELAPPAAPSLASPSRPSLSSRSGVGSGPSLPSPPASPDAADLAQDIEALEALIAADLAAPSHTTDEDDIALLASLESY